jgi:hypothetical protein
MRHFRQDRPLRAILRRDASLAVLAGFALVQEERPLLMRLLRSGNPLFVAIEPTG